MRLRLLCLSVTTAVAMVGLAAVPSGAVARAGLHRVLTLTFESDLPSTLADGTLVPAKTGPRATVLLGGAGTPLTVVPGYGGGNAIQLPAPCQGASCARGLLRVGADHALRPGTGDLRWGARVRLTADQTSAGSNIVQKGLSTDRGGQWKLQIDGTNGQPSCVMVATGSRKIYLAVSSVSVSDGAWHRAVCRRKGTELRVRVDGVTTGTTALPTGLDVSPMMRVRIGAKSVEPGNDQYFGTVDNVFVGAAL